MSGVFAGKYRLQRTLGQGAGWDLSVAITAKYPGTVWLKRLRQHPEAPADEQLAANFRALERVDHPNVARLLEAGRHGEVAFLVVAASASATTLGRVMSRSENVGPRLSMEVAAGIVADVAAGLDATGALVGVSHGSLHPGSVAIDEAGLAAAFFDGVVGPMAYRAPEQLQHQALDVRADIYSLGVMLFRLTTGRLPIEADGPDAVQTLLTEEVPRPSTLRPEYPEALERVVLSALTRDKWVRYQRVADFERDLRAFITESGVSGRGGRAALGGLVSSDDRSPSGARVDASAELLPDASPRVGPPRPTPSRRPPRPVRGARAPGASGGVAGRAREGASSAQRAMMLGLVLCVMLALIAVVVRSGSTRPELDERVVASDEPSTVPPEQGEGPVTDEDPEVEYVVKLSRPVKPPLKHVTRAASPKLPSGGAVSGPAPSDRGGTGRLTLTANLRGAQVLANGKTLGRAPLREVVMYTGDYVFEVRAGPGRWTSKGRIDTGRVLALNATLAASQVMFQGLAAGHACTIDGGTVSTTRRQPLFVGIGEHVVRCADSLGNAVIDGEFEATAGSVHRFKPRAP